MTLTAHRSAHGEAVQATATESLGDVVVLDTSVLLADPESIFAMGDADVVLPLKVIEELDNHKARADDLGRAARSVARTLEELRSGSANHDLRNPVGLPDGGTLRVAINGQQLERIEHLGLEVTKADNRILAAALGLVERARSVRLVSADVNLRLKAAALGLPAEEHVQTRPGFHTTANPGWRHAEVTRQLVDAVHAAHRVALADLDPADAEALSPLRVNEFGVLTAGQGSVLVRRRDRDLALVWDKQTAWDLHPRSKEQRFALDLLLDPDVPIVALSGQAGTGKTMLAVAAGLEQVIEPTAHRYDRLMVIRPMFAVGHQEVGFLPGDLREKLEPWFSTIEDTVTALREDRSRRLAREMVEEWVDEGVVDLQPVTYLRGRSLHRTFVIVDEAQSMEPLTLKTILTRLGEGSKVVFTGDVSQIDNPFVSERTSALSVLADRFSGNALFGHLVLTKGERSPVADLAAELL
ncbi:MAG: PhoH family protein [Actinomycetota bacterium]|nr:PhoH family protein [Actinomycetota bacterium]